jgi:hypothetical protein
VTRALLPALGVALSLALPGRAGAQGLGPLRDAALRTAPQYVRYRLGGPLDETLSQLAVPVFVTVPLGRALTIDAGSAFASSAVSRGDSSSTISGLTDTQLRAHYTFGSDFVVLTAGVNLPTGNATARSEQIPAALRIGSDFLTFPISNMGTGLGITGGVAVARPVGAWSLGAGASLRRSGAYEPFELSPTTRLRYQPGNEYRARVGADRTTAAGQLTLGLTYSTFGDDEVAGSVYNTGDRTTAQASYVGALGARTLTLSAWNLYRGAGARADGARAPWENVANALVAIGGTVGERLWLEPSVQLRHWLRRVDAGGTTGARSEGSWLAEVGLRTRVGTPIGGLSPSVSYTVGRLGAGASDAGINGFRVGMAAGLP